MFERLLRVESTDDTCVATMVVLELTVSGAIATSPPEVVVVVTTVCDATYAVSRGEAAYVVL
jgi:hypothetical protein